MASHMFSFAWLAAGLWSVRPSKYKGAQASALWHSNCTNRHRECREGLSPGTKRAVACTKASLLQNATPGLDDSQRDGVNEHRGI
jgi:hypothetical protein